MNRSAAFCLVLSVVLAACSLQPVHAQDGGLAFLRIGTNAKAASMGDTQVAYSRDAFSTYWNPAGLAAATMNSVSISYHSWIADTRTYALAARLGAGSRGAFGLFATAQGSSGLEARTAPGAPDGTFSVQFVSTGVSYGHRAGPLRAGVTVKYLTERIFDRASDGYAFDFGVQSDLLGGGLQLGAALQHVGAMQPLAAQATELPKTLRAGAAVSPFHILGSDDDAVLLRALLMGEVVHYVSGETTQIHAGVSVEVLEFIRLRTGYISNDALRRFSYGLGFGFEGIVFDYAYVPFEGGFEGPGHILTLIYEW
jgi:hypothetical protein